MGLSHPGIAYYGVGRHIFTPAHQALCALLLRLRKEAGLPQAELAQRLDLPQSWVSKVETGERRIDMVELWALCEALGVSLVTVAEEFDAAARKAKRKRRRSARDEGA